MKSRRLILIALATGAACLLWAADPAGEDGDAAAYPETRSFAQPVRDDPVGKAITEDRAFWGAPPVMPHSFAREEDGPLCLTCHARANRVAQRHRAIDPVPHAEFSQCQQCHVKAGDATVAPLAESDFVGLDYPGPGSRAHPYAPPTIPHQQFMRDNCLACHGPTGRQRIRTPHPQRSQCQQCHVPDASKNYDRPLDWMRLHGEL